MYKRIILLSAFIGAMGAGAAAQDKKVAIFDPAGKASDVVKEIVREEISQTVVNIGGYSVLERALINKVLEESKFQASGLVDDNQIGEMGKRMGADYVLVSSISPMSGNLYMSLKLIDVQTAKIDKQQTATTQKGEVDLVSVTQKLTKKLVGKKFSFF